MLTNLISQIKKDLESNEFVIKEIYIKSEQRAFLLSEFKCTYVGYNVIKFEKR